MPEYTAEELRRLDQEAHNQLKSEKWDEAVQTFTMLLEIDDNPALRNNLAYALSKQGRNDEALDVLGPTLASTELNPFSRALASLILQDMQRKGDSIEHVKEAIRHFDRGVKNPLAVGIDPRAWREYTVIIKRAAGCLGDHRLVIDLHRRWERYYQMPEDLFQVGVAYFNLGYPDRAAKVWSRMARGDWSFVQGYIETATAVGLGTVPGFDLPYLPPRFDKSEEGMTAECFKEELLDGGCRALVLAQVLKLELPEGMSAELVRTLVSLDDDWGISFGQAVLDSNSMPMSWKTSAAKALIDRGVYRADEPISMMVDGMSRTVQITEQRVGPASPEELAELENVRKLLIDERYDEALERLESDFEEGSLPLEGIELLGKLYGTLGDHKQAQAMVEIMLHVAKNAGSMNEVRIPVTDIYFRLGDYDQAAEHFDQIVYEDLPEALKERYSYIQKFLEEALE
jgi:tetratricopeptide (TPR) repeat protein